MGRKKGGTNKPNHRAGGARPGAGRPRKATLRSSDLLLEPNSSSGEFPGPALFSTMSGGKISPIDSKQTYDLPPSIGSGAVQTVNVENIHPDLVPWIKMPHHIRLCVSIQTQEIVDTMSQRVFPRQQPYINGLYTLSDEPTKADAVQHSPPPPPFHSASHIDSSILFSAMTSSNIPSRTGTPQGQGPNQRRPRRCAVCLQAGEEQAALHCPGRGDRSRCPRFSSQGTEPLTPQSTFLSPEHGSHQLPQSTLFTPQVHTQGLLSPMMSQGSGVGLSPSLHSYTPGNGQPYSPPHVSMGLAIPLTPASPSYNFTSLPPTPNPSATGEMTLTLQHGQQDPNGQSRRRARHCKVCEEFNQPDSVSSQCPGRGNRRLCPSYPSSSQQDPA